MIALGWMLILWGIALLTLVLVLGVACAVMTIFAASRYRDRSNNGDVEIAKLIKSCRLDKEHAARINRDWLMNAGTRKDNSNA